MTDALTIITEANTQILAITSETDPPIISVVAEGPIGPPDTRPRPSDIAFNVFGEYGPNEILVRIELAAAITIVPSRCRASAEDYPNPSAQVVITHEANNINTTIALVEFLANGTASFSFPAGFIVSPGTIRVSSTNASYGLQDFSITISGDR